MRTRPIWMVPTAACLLAGAASTAAGAVLGQTGGAGSAGAGALAAFAFWVSGGPIQARAMRDPDWNSLGLVLGGFLLRALGLAIGLALAARVPGLVAGWTGVGAMAATLGWLVALVVQVARARVPVHDPRPPGGTTSSDE